MLTKSIEYLLVIQYILYVDELSTLPAKLIGADVRLSLRPSDDLLWTGPTKTQQNWTQ